MSTKKTTRWARVTARAMAAMADDADEDSQSAAIKEIDKALEDDDLSDSERKALEDAKKILAKKIDEAKNGKAVDDIAGEDDASQRMRAMGRAMGATETRHAFITDSIGRRRLAVVEKRIPRSK